MQTTNLKHEIVSENIFTKAGHLIGKDNYQEKKPTQPYNQCDRLFVDHTNKTFWFSTTKDVQHTKQLIKA